MKKILTIVSVLCCLFGAVGCSKKEYKSEDYEMIELINMLEEMREDAGEGVDISYSVKETLKGKYEVEIVLAFGEHQLKMSTVMDSVADIQASLDDSEGYQNWIFSVDGIEYDMDTAIVIADHYYDTLYAD